MWNPQNLIQYGGEFGTAQNAYPPNRAGELYGNDKSFGDASSPDAHRTLFLGDLSYFCTEEDLCAVFSPFGQISTVRVRRGVTSESLMHGFIALDSHEAAKRAIAELDGKIFMGRHMRVQLSSEGPRPLAPKEGLVQIHVSFISKQLNFLVTEVVLRDIFSPYGAISDVAVRRHTIVQKQNRQSGYGFVYFHDIDAAYKAITALKQNTINDITFDCSVSHKSEHYGRKNVAYIPPVPAAGGGGEAWDGSGSNGMLAIPSPPQQSPSHNSRSFSRIPSVNAEMSKAAAAAAAAAASYNNCLTAVGSIPRTPHNTPLMQSLPWQQQQSQQSPSQFASFMTGTASASASASTAILPPPLMSGDFARDFSALSLQSYDSNSTNLTNLSNSEHGRQGQAAGAGGGGATGAVGLPMWLASANSSLNSNSGEFKSRLTATAPEFRPSIDPASAAVNAAVSSRYFAATGPGQQQQQQQQSSSEFHPAGGGSLSFSYPSTLSQFHNFEKTMTMATGHSNSSKEAHFPLSLYQDSSSTAATGYGNFNMLFSNHHAAMTTAGNDGGSGGGGGGHHHMSFPSNFGQLFDQAAAAPAVSVAAADSSSSAFSVIFKAAGPNPLPPPESSADDQLQQALRRRRGSSLDDEPSAPDETASPPGW